MIALAPRRRYRVYVAYLTRLYRRPTRADRPPRPERRIYQVRCAHPAKSDRHTTFATRPIRGALARARVNQRGPWSRCSPVLMELVYRQYSTWATAQPDASSIPRGRRTSSCRDYLMKISTRPSETSLCEDISRVTVCIARGIAWFGPLYRILRSSRAPPRDALQ